MSQLPFDCLNDIFEYLEDDKVTLHSCLLVNHLWCEVSVRILWRFIRNYNTLIACLPDNSKNEIITLTSASSPPMFNYASFCKVLSTRQVNGNIERLLNHNQQSQNLKNNLLKVTREIFKFLIAQTSLREVDVTSTSFEIDCQEFTSNPGVTGCLGNLSRLSCNSNICSEFLYQLSQTCHSIRSLNIEFKEVVPNGLADLISAQQNLKHLNMYSNECGDLEADIIILLNNLPDTLIKLGIGLDFLIPLSFFAKFTNLQEMILTFYDRTFLEDFKELQYTTFSNLQILKFPGKCPRNELLIKLLENNGKNLKEFYVPDVDFSNLPIAELCPNLRKLSTGFKYDEIETLKKILDSCQYLESIQVWCCGDYLSERGLFKIFVKYSPKNFYELKLSYYEEFSVKSDLLPEELESFLISWSNRIPQKSLSLVIIRNRSDKTLDQIDDNMEIIKKYTELGIIKKFRAIKCFSEDFE